VPDEEIHLQPAPASGERKPIEQWAEAKKHTGAESWKFAVAKAFRQWPEGAEVTETDYDKAVKEASDQPLGYGAPRQTKPLHEWAEEDAALVNRITAYQGWSRDEQITEQEFNAAKALVR
jgi:hypothetical protein